MPVAIPRPNISILENGLDDSTHQVTQEALSTFFLDPRRGNGTGIEYPESGGIYVYKIGGILEEKGEEIYINNAVPLLYPERGLPWPEAIVAINEVKRFLVSQIRFFGKNKILLASALLKPIHTLETWLQEFISFADQVLLSVYFKPNYYTDVAKEVDVFVATLLTQIGIRQDIAQSFSRIIKTVIELDTAYRYRFEDIMSETSANQLLAEPTQEIKRLFNIFSEREINRRKREGEESHVITKTRTMVNLMNIFLKIPRVKRGFREAIKAINFSKIQLDEIDKYAVLRLDGYNFMGQSIEERGQRYLDLYNGNPPMAIVIKNPRH